MVATAAAASLSVIMWVRAQVKRGLPTNPSLSH